MKAHEIMTGTVHTAKRDTSIGDLAMLMTERRISGVPVVTDDGHVIGIVSESDLMRRAEMGTQKRRKWWLAVFQDSDALARDYLKTHGRKAEDVMSRYVVTVAPTAPLSEVAEILDRNNLKRVPVVTDGKIVGIITRGDLVRALATADRGRGTQPADNASVQHALIASIEKQPWLTPTYISATVTDGVVELWGFIGSEDQRQALHVLVREVAGAREIKDKLTLGMRHLSSAA